MYCLNSQGVRGGSVSFGFSFSTSADEAVTGVEVDIETVLPIMVGVKNGMAAEFRQVVVDFAMVEMLK